MVPLPTETPTQTPAPITPRGGGPSLSAHAVSSAWTDERVVRAVRLYLVEGFTAEEVAMELGAGVSKSAVIGKIHRLGLFKRDVRGALCTTRRLRARRPEPAPRIEPRLPPRQPPKPMPPLREVPPTGEPRVLADLPCHGACRWPIDEPGSGNMHLALFCAGPVTKTGPYCAAHQALTTRPSRQPDRRPEPRS